MLFSNISLLTAEMTIAEHQYLAVENERITYIGSVAPPHADGEIYDGAGKLLLPGFVNAHSHTAMTLLRGYGENLALADWLNQRIFPFEAQLTARDIYYGTLLGCAEMLRFGITSTTDMYFFGEAMARAFIEAGVKANLAVSTTCFDTRSYFQLPVYQEAVALFKNYHNAANGRIRVELSLHAEYTSSERVAREISETAHRLGAAMQVHLAETQTEYDECRARHGGLTPTAYLASVGLFDVPTTAAHGIFLADADFEILRAKQVTIATCPKSNLKLASGICPVPQLLQKGINVALGTDSVASNNNLNFAEEIKFYALLHKAAASDSTAITPAQALAAATVNGARAQQRPDCGTLAVGQKADLLALDITAPYWQPQHSLLNNLIYSACGTDVVLTMVDGQILYRDGVFTTLDLTKIIAEVQATQQRVLAALK